MREPGEEDLPLRQEYPAQDPRFTVRRVPLSPEEVELYYQGMANRVLWPVSHYMAEHIEFNPAFMRAYAEVNQRFAAAVLEEAGDDDVIWAHDYHLMLVPQAIRQVRPAATIGYFWHIPWPGMELFRILPWARRLIQGMLSCDVVGFHVHEYVRNFLEGAHALLGAQVHGNRAGWQGRLVRAEAHPIGIDVAGFEHMAASDEVRREAEALRREIGTEFLVVGIDRLDYTKGILSRLLAFEDFLEQNPAYHGRVALCQVATPSRTEVESYQLIKREVDEAVGRINGAFASNNWVPVHYRYRTYSQQELCHFYRAADVALITPLRDGMNLVTQEFVAATEGGTLVLSELTGAAHLLPEALLVNPYDQESMVRAMGRALEMSAAEKRQRLRRLKDRVAALDVHRWAETFLQSLQGTPPHSARLAVRRWARSVLHALPGRDASGWSGGASRGS
ncbi:MAG: trehalose-6-phosphate synthase [Candidatus Latescibacterota bacterium]